MEYIGEEHYCAEILEKEDDWFEKGQMVIACKKIDHGEERSKIIGNIVRITAQLAELSFSFKKFKNTRVIFLGKESMTLLFYYYQNQFYVVQPNVSITTMATFLLETTQIGFVIRSIIDDMHCPLFRSIPKPISDEELYEEFFKELYD